MQFPLFEARELTDETRRSAEGSFIQLPDGITHFELSGFSQSSNGRNIVVLVHGFSVPYFIFDPTFEFLTQAGYCVLRYDLFGRGYSDRPHARYNIDLFVKQLLALLDALRFTHPLNLVGLSMGGPITATFTARHPERVRSLTLIDPAGVRPISLTPMLKAMKLPGIAEALFGLFGSESMVKSAAKDFYDPEMVGFFLDKYKVQMQYKGFKRAVLSSIRNNMLGSFMESYHSIGKKDKPVLIFWGRNDVTVPFEHSNELLSAMPNAELHVIENCGHIPHYEKPEVFNPILINFLEGKKWMNHE